MLKLISDEHSITENEFRVFENRFINKIPESFKNHYLKTNGGRTSEKDRLEENWGFQIDNFFSIKFGNLLIEELVEAFSEMFKDLFIADPETYSDFGKWKKYEFIPFADCPGYMIFMSLKNDDYGSIYAFYSASSIENIFPSFDEFIKELYKLE
jgi:hypothetical protein